MPEILVSYSSVSSSMTKWKAKSNNHLQVPHSVDDILQNLPPHHDPHPVTFIENEQFIHAVPSSCLQAGQSVAVYRKSQLDTISKVSQMAFCDGTFKCFPSYFYQMLVIHFLVKDHVSVFNSLPSSF
jgi:hypothetical protein